ncbi:MAG: MipA/OmpV family protein [Halobacteriovoraceae bacterium]|jgi:MipA family protein|nr:MipA/OmpV family protein [Halobacteriovoraceae bacterium]MBT5094427.1 MipA/OmpV family protein [Halobacteriovoraceae bacterium]
MLKIISDKTILLLLLSFSFEVTAQVTSSLSGKSVPLFEAGAGMVVADVPDYPASGHNTTHTVPFPTALYRGEVVRADENGGIRGRFLKSEQYELNLSFGGALPADSSDNPDRLGMPDLDLMLEVGPALFIHFLPKGRYKNKKLTLSLPVRQVAMTDGTYLENRGVVFDPFLFYIHENLFFKNFLLFLGTGARWGTRKYMETFYSVPDQFSNSSRETFFAKGGFLGSHFNTGFSYLLSKDVLAFIGMEHAIYKGASNESSPLFAKKNNTTLAMGFVWWFYKSKAQGVRY